MKDSDYDHVYTVTADVYEGDHQYQIALGAMRQVRFTPLIGSRFSAAGC